jgi:hypothetical protein
MVKSQLHSRKENWLADFSFPGHRFAGERRFREGAVIGASDGIAIDLWWWGSFKDDLGDLGHGGVRGIQGRAPM